MVVSAVQVVKVAKCVIVGKTVNVEKNVMVFALKISKNYFEI